MSNARFSPDELQSRAKSQGVTISDQVMGLHSRAPQFGGIIGLFDIISKKAGMPVTVTDAKTGKQLLHLSGTGFLDTALNVVKTKDPKAYTAMTGITPQQKVSQLSQPKPRQTFGEPTITRRSLLG